MTNVVIREEFPTPCENLVGVDFVIERANFLILVRNGSPRWCVWPA